MKRGITCTPIRPNEGDLPDIGRWLLEHARSARQDEVAEWIPYLFGTSECPSCQTEIDVITTVLATAINGG